MRIGGTNFVLSEKYSLYFTFSGYYVKALSHLTLVLEIWGVLVYNGAVLSWYALFGYQFSALVVVIKVSSES